MKRFLSRASVLAVLAAGVFLADAAQAQVGGNLRPGGGNLPSIPGAQDPNAAGSRRPAPGVPGSQVDTETVAPADRPGTEMRPTEALFDAINRGDISAARDAINRGADLRGRNILGFTPLELSVDLGRRDISFLLLSLRGIDGQPEPRFARPAPPAQSEAERARAARLQAERAEAARRASARAAPASGPTVPQAPRLFVGDGGTPAPDAGFLGFGGGKRDVR